jgi:hypothetical protein
MEEEKQHLNEMSVIVHAALKTLKMGETGTVSCSKQFNANELREYITAYAFHKNKWFAVKHDAVSNVLFCERVPQPSWDKPKEDKDADEEL